MGLRKGSRGSAVKALQEALSEQGFNPGKIDGIFGDATVAALKAFQASTNLLIDGVAGQQTLSSLNLNEIKLSSPMKMSKRLTSEIVAQLFPGAPKSNVRKYLPSIVDTLKASNLDDKNMTLMALSTIRAETAGFAPINEYKSKYNTSPGGHPFDLYDNRKDLGNRGKPDGERYKGRGFIQLTGRANYERIGKKIGMGMKLVENPDLANDPEIAAKILVAFLADKERKIKEALIHKDLKAARRLVNGGSHGLTSFSDCFRKGQKMLA